MQKLRIQDRVAAGRVETLMWIMSAAFLMVFCFSIHVKAADEIPVIEKVQLINDRDIEIYWSEEVTGAGWVESQRIGSELVKQEQNYTVTVNGEARELYYGYWRYPEYDNYEIEAKGVVYYTQRDDTYHPNYDANPKTTLRLAEPIADLTNLPEIKIAIKGNVIKGRTTDAFVPAQTVSVEKYEPFYTQERTLDCGVKVLGSAKVREAAMDKAKEMLEVLLANQTVANRMGDAGCMMGLYGEGEIGYDIPEHRFDFDVEYLYVEGFGGTQLASICDANVLRLNTGSYQTGYPNESILTHEFAHTVYNYGLSETQKQEWINIYNTSTGSGKWANSYAGSNKDEYFATLSAIWFNAMDDTDGEWDGVRGPINTRAELKVYDRAAYDFLANIYVSDQYLPSPWQNGSIPDNYTWPGAEEDQDCKVTFIYGNGMANSVQDVKKGSKVTKPAGTPERNGYTFKGWYLGTQLYDFNSEVTADITLEAKWDEIKVNKVAFIYNNGMADATQTIKEGDKVTKPAAPKKKGYTFTGWYLGTQQYDFNSIVTDNLTLQAKWQKVTVKKTSLSSVKAQKGRKVLVKIRKQKGVKGYKITYAKNKKLTKSAKVTYTTSLKKTLKLKKGTYYIGVQAYKTDSTGKKVTGKMSAVKKVKVK